MVAPDRSRLRVWLREGFEHAERWKRRDWERHERQRRRRLRLLFDDEVRGLVLLSGLRVRRWSLLRPAVLSQGRQPAMWAESFQQCRLLSGTLMRQPQIADRNDMAMSVVTPAMRWTRLATRSVARTKTVAQPGWALFLAASLLLPMQAAAEDCPNEVPAVPYSDAKWARLRDHFERALSDFDRCGKGWRACVGEIAPRYARGWVDARREVDRFSTHYMGIPYAVKKQCPAYSFNGVPGAVEDVCTNLFSEEACRKELTEAIGALREAATLEACLYSTVKPCGGDDGNSDPSEVRKHEGSPEMSARSDRDLAGDGDVETNEGEDDSSPGATEPTLDTSSGTNPSAQAESEPERKRRAVAADADRLAEQQQVADEYMTGLVNSGAAAVKVGNGARWGQLDFGFSPASIVYTAGAGGVGPALSLRVTQAIWFSGCERGRDCLGIEASARYLAAFGYSELLGGADESRIEGSLALWFDEVGIATELGHSLRFGDSAFGPGLLFALDGHRKEMLLAVGAFWLPVTGRLQERLAVGFGSPLSGRLMLSVSMGILGLELSVARIVSATGQEEVLFLAPMGLRLPW